MRYHNSVNTLFCELRLLFLSGFIVISGLANKIDAQQDAFPGAEGFGRYATGGRGGDVYHVTSLADYGPGSLRAGIAGASGPRTIVFDVSGNIQMTGRLKIDRPNITIAGQTAPGDGITLAGNALYVAESNVIVRYLRVRYGDQTGDDGDAVSITSGSNIIIDHVTASWSIDETFSFQSGSLDSLTVQWCMITESLRDSHHEKGKHGYGGIMGCLRQSVHHNLYAHHSSRNPKVSGRRHCEVDFRNNVIYNWGFNSCYDGTKSYINWANNYYKAGPATSSGVRDRIFRLSDAPVDPENEGWEVSNTYTTTLYAEGNYVDGFPAITADNWSGGIDFNDGATEASNRGFVPFNFPAITEQSAEEAYALVLESAGASRARDVIDARIVNEVLSGTTTYFGSKTGDPGIIDSQNDVGGWPVLDELARDPGFDTDQDGMPDMWETDNGLNPTDPEDRNDDRNEDGYTNLEEYLHEVISMSTVSVKDGNAYEIKSLHCYPNPSRAGFTIDLPAAGFSTIEIFNSYGQIVFFATTTGSTIIFNDHRLTSGIYLIRVSDSSKAIYNHKQMID